MKNNYNTVSEDNVSINELKDITDFIKADKRFKESEENQRVFYLMKDGVQVGRVWFKWGLGGWNLILEGDQPNEWEKRNPLTKEKLIKFIE